MPQSPGIELSTYAAQKVNDLRRLQAALDLDGSKLVGFHTLFGFLRLLDGRCPRSVRAALRGAGTSSLHAARLALVRLGVCLVVIRAGGLRVFGRVRLRLRLLLIFGGFTLRGRFRLCLRRSLGGARREHEHAEHSAYRPSPERGNPTTHDRLRAYAGGEGRSTGDGARPGVRRRYRGEITCTHNLGGEGKLKMSPSPPLTTSLGAPVQCSVDGPGLRLKHLLVEGADLFQCFASTIHIVTGLLCSTPSAIRVSVCFLCIRRVQLLA